MNSQYHNFVYLWWATPSSDGGSPITGYKVEWSTDGGTNWEVLVDDTERTVRNYSFLSSRLTPGATFHFRVRALNADGESAPSNVVSFTVPSPSGRGIPTNVRITETSSGAAQVSWDAPTDLPEGQSAWLYYLFKSDDNGDFWSQLAVIHAPTLSYTDNSVSSGRTYGYRLRAAYGVNLDRSVPSDFSEPAYIKLSTPPDEVSSLTVTSVSASIIDLSWSAPSYDGGSPITGYRVDIRTVTPQAYVRLDETTSTSYRVTGLNHSTQYRILVRAVNNTGAGIQTAITSTTTAATRPDAPTGLTATPTGRTTIEVSWTAAEETGGSPITSYLVQVSPTRFSPGNIDCFSPCAQRNVAEHIRTTTVTGLQPSTIYYIQIFTLAAGNPGGLIFSSASSTISATTDAVSAPDAPTGLTAAASGPNSHDLSWTAPADDGGAAITSYQVESSSTGDPGSFSVLLPASLGNAIPRFSRPVSPGTITYYRVKAHNSVGTGAPSNAVRATTKVVTAPAAPTGLTATADGPSVINLRWIAPSDNGGAAITGYRIESFRLGGGFWTEVTRNTQSTATTYMHTGLTANTKLHYRVSAINTAGTGGASSSVRATTTAATAPAAPTELTAKPDGPTIINLSWTAPSRNGGVAITGYQIESSPTGTGDTWTNLVDNTESTTTTYAHTGLTAGTTRHYRVRAINSVDPGAWSNVDMATTAAVATAPDAPTALTATAEGQTTITLSWTAPASNGGAVIMGYRIEVSTDGGTSFSELVASHSTTSYSHTGLDAGTARHYRVLAINSAGRSGWSNTGSATTAAATAPGAPPNLQVFSPGFHDVRLTWGRPPSDSPITGYKVEWSTDGGTNWEALIGYDDLTRTRYQFLSSRLTPGSVFHFRVLARSASGDSDPSDAVSVTAASAPGSGIATNVRVRQTSANAAQISWDAPTDLPSGHQTFGYNVYKSDDDGDFWSQFARDVTTTTYTDDQVSAGKTYGYRVTTWIGPSEDEALQGQFSDAAFLTITIARAPDAPTSLTAVANGQTTINLNWTAPASNGGSPITGYLIEVSTDRGATFTPLVPSHPTISYAHTGLTAGTTRHYRVRAINSVNLGDPSNVATATTADVANPTAPGAPRSLTATASGQTTINLTWTAPASNGGAAITGYTLEVSTDGGTTFTSLVASQLATTYAHTGLSAGVTRHYRVRATNSATLSGAWSNVVNATTASSGGGGGGGGPSLPALTFAAASASVDEAAGTYRVQVTLSASSSTATTLSYTLSGTATQGTDYTIQSSVTLPANATSAQIPIVIVNDQEEEPDETILVTLVSSNGYTLGSITAFTLTITDNDGTTVSFAQTLSDQSYEVGVPIQDLTLPAAQQGTPPYRYALTPELPKGLTFDVSTRVLSGTPTEAAAAKTYTYTVTDASDNTAMQQFTLAVVQPEALTFTETIADQKYPVQIPVPDQILPPAAGGVAPYTYTLTPELPEGLTFDPSTRALRGTPTEVASTQTYTYVAEDRAGTQTQQTFDLEVYQMSFTERVPNQSYARGEPIADLVLPEATGGVSPIAYTLNLLELPLGLQFDLPTRTIRGIPTEMTPPRSLTYRAVDVNQAEDRLTFTMEVISPVSTEAASGRPQEFRVYPNYPNPFQRSTHLVLDLPWPAQVRVDVLDMTGRRVMAIPAANLSAGWNHEIELTGLELSSGTYLYRIQATSMEDPSSSVYVGQFVRVK